MNKQKRILVTGGGGYIGTHVVEQLLKRKNKVRIYDQLVFGRKPLADLEKNPNLEIIKGELSDLYKLSLALKDVDEVVHLAGLVGDPACDIDKDFTIHMNVVSTKIIKELAKSFAIKKFIFASSCSVYGTSETLVDETSRLHPVSLYAKTKIDSERELLNDVSGNFHPVILRFATVFGHSRRPRFDLVANFFTAQAYNDGLITVTGSTQWRPFIHASDIARAIAKVSEASFKLVDRQIYNVGDSSLNYTIGDLASLIAGIIKKNTKGNNVKIQINDNPYDTRNYKVSFNKIRQKLGFKAKVSLKDGIYEIYDSFRKGIYKKHYRHPMYSNLEMTKLMHREYCSVAAKNETQPPLSLA